MERVPRGPTDRFKRSQWHPGARKRPLPPENRCFGVFFGLNALVLGRESIVLTKLFSSTPSGCVVRQDATRWALSGGPATLQSSFDRRFWAKTTPLPKTQKVFSLGGAGMVDQAARCDAHTVGTLGWMVWGLNSRLARFWMVSRTRSVKKQALLGTFGPFLGPKAVLCSHFCAWMASNGPKTRQIG